MSVWRDYVQAWPALKAHKILRIQQNRLHPIPVTLLTSSSRQVTVLGLVQNFIKIPLVCKGGGCKVFQVCVSRWVDTVRQRVTDDAVMDRCNSSCLHPLLQGVALSRCTWSSRIARCPWGEHLGLVSKTGSKVRHTHPRLRYPSRWHQMLQFRVG